MLGDLLEAGEDGLHGLLGVFGLAVRRRLSLWKDWRPWLASLGLALPGSLLLMEFSVSVSQTYQRLIHPTIFRSTGLTVGPALPCCCAMSFSWPPGPGPVDL